MAEMQSPEECWHSFVFLDYYVLLYQFYDKFMIQKLYAPLLYITSLKLIDTTITSYFIKVKS